MSLRIVWIIMFAMAALPALAQEKPENNAEPTSIPAPVAPTSQSPLPSLFFSPEEKASIAQAQLYYQERLKAPPEDDLLDQLQGIKAEKKPDEVVEKQYEQFYLESLIYHTPNDWTLWLKTIRGSEKWGLSALNTINNNLQLLSVSKESITLEWKPRNWMYVSKKFTGEHPHIKLNVEKKTVIFTLAVNQTMESSVMNIVEGVTAIVPVPDANATTTNPAVPPTK